MLFEWMGRQEKQEVSDCIGQVYIELSTACNLSCVTCVRNSIHDFAIAHLQQVLMKKIVAQLRPFKNIERIVLLGFGEALCNPDIQWHLTQLATPGIPIILVTNGMRIDRALAEMFVRLPLSAVYISIDDTDDTDPVIRKGSDAAVPLAAVALLETIKKEYKSVKPLIGVETVATIHNIQRIPHIISRAKEAGAQRCIVTNVFPYTDEMSKAIVYSIDGNNDGLKCIQKKFMKDASVTVASGNASVLRRCPFIEKGTVFITVHGDVVPCPELAYTHISYYFGNPRMHKRHVFGNIGKDNLADIWNSSEFVHFRETFRYYEFPDCTLCVEPDMCYYRTVENKDCYWNTSPCGECLWAKGIVMCP